MAQEISLYDIYINEAVRDFGDCLRNAIFTNDDYASLTELEHAETKDTFAEIIKKLLRRNYKGWLPKEKSLEEIMKLVDDYGVRLIRAAIISHALTWKER
jgi:hypothetical protein